MILPLPPVASSILPAVVIVSPSISRSPAIVVVEVAPYPIPTSTISLVPCPVKTIVSRRLEELPLLAAIASLNLPASSVSAAVPTSAVIAAKLVCYCAELSDVNKIVDISSPSAPAAPLSFTKYKREPVVPLFVFFI